MKNIFGFILFIFLCYWALKGCSGNTSKVIDDIKVTQPEVVIDTTHSSEDACGEGDIPINQDYFDEVSYAVFRVGDKVVGTMAIMHQTICSEPLLTFNQRDFTPSQLNILLNEYGFTSSSPNLYKSVVLFDWQLPNFISVEIKHLRLGIEGDKVFVIQK